MSGYRCSTCFDTKKMRIADDLFWCSACTPKNFAGEPCDADDVLPAQVINADSRMKISYSVPTSYVTSTAQDTVNMIVTAANTDFTTNPYTVTTETDDPPEDVPEGYLDATTRDPSICANCGSPDMDLFDVSRLFTMYGYEIQRHNGVWTIMATEDSTDVGEITSPLSFECAECGQNSFVDLPVEYR